MVQELEQPKLVIRGSGKLLHCSIALLAQSALGAAVGLRRLALFLGSGWVIPVQQQLDAHVIVQLQSEVPEKWAIEPGKAGRGSLVGNVTAEDARETARKTRLVLSTP